MLERGRTARAALVVALAACATARHDAPQVHAVRIEGARQVDAGDVKKHLLTTENSWIPFSRKQYFDEDAWRTDLRRIEKYYRAQGYYQARVTGSEVRPHGKDAVDVVATVDEGEPTRLGSVDVRGIEDLSRKDREPLLDHLELKVGDVFLSGRWEGLKERLLRTLHEEGYAAATVQGEVKVGLDTRRADVDLDLAHGPRYRFGELWVKEHRPARVPDWRITEQASAAARPGDWYSLRAQHEAELRVTRLGVFGAVKVRPGEPDPSTLTVPLEVDVQESRFHTLSAGGGVAVDQTRQEARATAGYVDRDFRGSLEKLTLTAMLGYAWIPTFYASSSSGAQHGIVGQLGAELEQPRFFSRDLKLDSKVTLQRGIDPAYRFYGAAGRLALVYQPTNHLTVTPSYNLEYYRLESGVAQLGGTAPALLFGCPANCVLSYAEQLVEWDQRDDRQEPRSGYYLAVSLQEGGGILGGSFDYFRVIPEARGYVSFLDEDALTFALRARVGTLLPAHGGDASSPIVSRFFSGGNDMRGFNARRLAPQVVVPKPGSTTEGYTVPVGGNGLFELSFETRYALTRSLELAAFVDTGFVTTQHLDLRDPGFFRQNLLVAVGGGPRYRTPLGPIRLDFGFRPDVGPPLQVTTVPGSTVTAPSRSSCFGLGKGGPRAGAPEGPCVIHISIGEAF